MKLYKIDNITDMPDRWVGTQAEAKTGARQVGGDWEQVDVPTDKEGLIEWLNEWQLPPPVTATQLVPVYGAQEVDELHEAEQRAIAAARPPSGTVDQPSAASCHVCGQGYGYENYERALAARTALAQIDASMCARAIGQMHGPELAKIVGAAIERMRELATQVSSNAADL